MNEGRGVTTIIAHSSNVGHRRRLQFDSIVMYRISVQCRHHLNDCRFLLLNSSIAPSYEQTTSCHGCHSIRSTTDLYAIAFQPKDLKRALHQLPTFNTASPIFMTIRSRACHLSVRPRGAMLLLSHVVFVCLCFYLPLNLTCSALYGNRSIDILPIYEFKPSESSLDDFVYSRVDRISNKSNVIVSYFLQPSRGHCIMTSGSRLVGWVPWKPDKI